MAWIIFAFLHSAYVRPNDSSVDSLSSSRDPLWPTGRTTVAKWLRDRRISYGRVSNDVFILINGACGDVREREVGEGRDEDNARGGEKRREIERGASGSLSRDDDAPSPFLSRPIFLPPDASSPPPPSHSLSFLCTQVGDVSMVLLR